MNSYYKKFLKIFLINTFFIIFLISFIEIIFGYWFDKDNLGPYMREHRMKKTLYSLNIENEIHNFTYKRNYYGFRGNEIKPENIKLILIGGSTADERYKPEKFTITNYLNEKLKSNNFNLKIVNAGIEGQSTRGHINNLKHWFPKIKNLSPKYLIFYIGINDASFNGINVKDNMSDGMLKSSNKLESLTDNLKSRSLLYNYIRKIKHKYYAGNEKKRITYDYNYTTKEKKTGKKFTYLSYSQKLKNYNIDDLSKKYENIIKYYLDNIDKLSSHTKLLGAIPIFINQGMSRTEISDKLFIMNRSLIKHCKKKGYRCIDLAKKFNAKKEYFWDGMHTTALGSKEIANIIFPELANFLKK